METSVLKFTCHHAELACCNILISVPVSSTKSQKLFTNGMSELCSLHGVTGVGESGEYLSPKVDRQVGFGVLDLPTSFEGTVTYEQFGRALEAYNDGKKLSSAAYELAAQLGLGVRRAAEIARTYNMKRAFAMDLLHPAPTGVRTWMATLLLQKLHHLSLG